MWKNLFNPQDMREPGRCGNLFQGKGKRIQLPLEERKVEIGCKWGQNWRGGAGGRKSLNHNQEGLNFHIYQLAITYKELQKTLTDSAVSATPEACALADAPFSMAAQLVYTEKSPESLDQGLADSGTHAESSPEILVVNRVLWKASHAH